MSQSIAIQQRLEAGIETMNLALNNSQIELLLKLLNLLTQWNQVYNLTAIRSPIDMVGYHLLDSLSLIPYINSTPILDLGTGAGFPGLPLAIVHSELTFTLLDSNGKKVRFVRQAILELGLNNVNVVQDRIENYTNTTKFAIVVARALAPVSQLLAWTKPLLKTHGMLLALKGKNIHTELTSVNSELIKLHHLKIPYVEGQRIIVELTI